MAPARLVRLEQGQRHIRIDCIRLRRNRDRVYRSDFVEPHGAARLAGPARDLQRGHWFAGDYRFEPSRILDPGTLIQHGCKVDTSVFDITSLYDILGARYIC
jgi:hypothetical protein